MGNGKMSSNCFNTIKSFMGRMKDGNRNNDDSMSSSSSISGASYILPDPIDTSEDDSGVIIGRDNPPTPPPKKAIMTRAIVEPGRPIWSSTPISMLRRSHGFSDLRTVVQDNVYIEISAITSDSERNLVTNSDGRQRDIENEENSTLALYTTVINRPIRESQPLTNEIVHVQDDVVVEYNGIMNGTESGQSLNTSATDTTDRQSRLDGQRSNTARSDNDKFIDEKFVMNLYESRHSKRRKSIPANFFDNGSIEVIDDRKKESCPEMTEGSKNDEDSQSESDAMYYKLKKMRDVECVKMKEASNALRAIKERNDREWFDELLTEKILLETDLKTKLIVGKIRDLKYSDWRFSTPKHSGKVTISNFQYQLAQIPVKDHKYCEFFILMISHETDVFTSRVIRANDDKLVFNETFTLENLDENFRIKAEIFSYKMKISKPRRIAALLKKKSQNLCPIFRIYYENINTLEVQESAVLKSSFVPCGAFIITKSHINQNESCISQQQTDPRLKMDVKFTMSVDLNLSTKLSGFLTLGRADEQNNIVFWERKWCSLNGSLFSIYNYPQEEESSKPPESSVNLEYCFVPLTKPEAFPKKNVFVLKTGRPSTMNDSNNVILRKRNNFVLEKYFLQADTKEDFKKWTDELDSVLISLKEWKKLILVDEYY